jgi:hypothetical protein
MEIKDFEGVKEGDLVEILLKSNADWSAGWQGPDSFMVNEEEQISEPNRYIAGYVCTLPSQNESFCKNYVSIRPTWDKEKSRGAFMFHVGGMKVYLEAIESFEKK